MALSLLAEMFSKQQAQQRTQPGTKGLRRGVGSYGARPYQSRNPDAGAQREQQLMQSPVFSAFMEQFNPKTPVTDALRGRMATFQAMGGPLSRTSSSSSFLRAYGAPSGRSGGY